MSRPEATSGAPPPHGGAADYQILRRDPAAAGPGTAAPYGASPADPPWDLVVELVAAATMAPSRHNTQPWRFRFEPASQTIGLYADPARTLPVGDPDGRAVHIACGADRKSTRLNSSHVKISYAVFCLKKKKKKKKQ